MKDSLFGVISAVTIIVATMLSACTISPNTGDIDVSGPPTPISVPVIISVQTDNNKPKKEDKPQDEADKSIHACTLSAFTHQYRTENTNRGRARFDVKKQCLREFDEMFCRDQDIKCTEYN
ncbi:hypothetical protein [Psychrobacter sp. FDAARGOS_221]|uniref:hypothetical protein n=1 Tax=Psychrobacter sp. FDAARGOS_221 TaxID=1975705 RepID=UPI000BB56EC5|nr:hypothetical protein [Psychrobacter sp. FDAARGOS_221]PNK60059.1 hypothetical protein A6J60_003650 [Psychrobacter sp. FDAARGOS_221]